MSNESPKRVASIAVFDTKGRLLFGKRRDNEKWTMPGGHLDEGEAPGEGAQRELLEEANLQPDNFELLGHKVVTGGEGQEIHVWSFKVEVEERPSIKNDPDEEVNRWKWIDIDDGIPEEIASNLHSPKNVTLYFLGLQDWDEDEGEELQKGALAGVLAAGMLAAAPAQKTPEQPKAWTAEGLHNELHPIAHLESSFGKFTQHMKHTKGDFHTAIGAVGFKPVTAYEEYKRSKVLQGHYPNLLDQKKFMERAKTDHKFYNTLASTHWLRMKKLFKTPEKAAYAWRWGQGRAAKSNDAVINADPYVQHYKRLSAPVKKSESLQKSEEIERLLEYDDPIEASMALKLPGVTKEHLTRAITKYPFAAGPVKNAVVTHPLFDDSLLAELFHHSDKRVRALAAEHAKDPLLHDQAYADQDLRLRLVSNPHLSSEMVGKFISDRTVPSLKRLAMFDRQNAPKDAKDNFIREWASPDSTLDSSEFVANVLARHEVPADVADKIFESGNTYRISRLLSNPRTPPEAITKYVVNPPKQGNERLYWDESLGQWLEHPDAAQRLKPEHIDAIMHHGEFHSASALVDYHARMLSPKHLDQAVDHAKRHNSSNMVTRVCSHPDATPDMLHKIASCGDFYDMARATATMNSKVSPATVSMLLDDPKFKQKHVVAQRGHLQPHHISQLLRSDSPVVRSAALRNKTPGAVLPEHIDGLIAASDDEDNIMALKDLGDIGTPNPETVRKLIAHPNEYVNKAALKHIDASHLDQIISHPNEEVRLKGLMGASLKNLTPNHDQITRALMDSNQDVRAAATKFKLSPSHVAMALGDVYSKVRNSAAQQMGPEHVAQALFHADEGIRIRAAKHVDAHPEHLGPAFKDQSHIVRAAAVENPQAHIHHVRERLNDPHPLVAQAASKVLMHHEPDTVHRERVSVRMRTARLRRIRDDLASKAKEQVSPKEMDPADVAFLRDSGAGRLPNGNYSPAKLQQHIDSLPALDFNVSHAQYGSEFKYDPNYYDSGGPRLEHDHRLHHESQQRHSKDLSKVFQLNVTNDQVQKMKALGVYNTFRKIQQASHLSHHPVTPTTIGWVRYTGEHGPNENDGYFIDEVQSDFGQSLVRQATKQARDSGADEHEATQRAEKEYPEEHFKHISNVLFGGKAPNEVLHEAFHQHLRDKGQHGAQIHIHATKTKARLSRLDSKRDVPGHFKTTYQQVPERMEMKPAKYGELKTQTNDMMHGDETYKGTLRKFEELASEWLRKSSNLGMEDSDTETAHDMLGFNPFVHSAFEAARFMASGPVLSIDVMRRALWNQDGNLEKAALEAYGFDPSDENLATLRSVMGMTGIAKSEEAQWTPKEIKASVAGSEEAAEGVKRAYASSSVHPVKLGGKHSKGSLLAKDPEAQIVYLLKPGSGGQSPASGADQDSSSQSAREACFYEVADHLGLGQYVPKASMILMDDQQVAAIHLLPFSYKNLEKKRHTDAPLVMRTLNTYLRLGILHRWAVLDFILGNPDRHGQNIMISKEGKLMLIDHGSAFAGSDFDPAYDQNSFIPYYLRAWTPEKVNFNRLTRQEKLKYMPVLAKDAKDAFLSWIRGLHEHVIEETLTKYGIDPGPALYRLGQIKMAAEDKDLAILQLWAGT